MKRMELDRMFFNSKKYIYGERIDNKELANASGWRIVIK